MVKIAATAVNTAGGGGAAKRSHCDNDPIYKVPL
jgi:hypothetical protein